MFVHIYYIDCTEREEAASGLVGTGTDTVRDLLVPGAVHMAGRLVATTVLKIVGLLVITRLVGPQHYGAYVVAFGIYSFAVQVGEAGIVTALVRRAEEPPETGWRTAGTLLAAAALILALLLAMLGQAIADYAAAAEIAWLLPLIAVALPLQLLTGVAIGRLERRLDYRLVARVELSRDLVYYLLAFALAATGWGATALGSALLAQHACGFMLAHRLAGRWPGFGFDRLEARALLRFATGFSGANLLWQARSLVLPLIAAPLIGPAATGVAGLTVGIVQALSAAMNIIWRMGVASLARVQGDAVSMAAGIGAAMRLSVLAAAVPLLGFGWLGGMLVSSLFGERWAAAVTLFPFVATAYLTAALFRPHSAALTALSRHGALAVFHAVHLAVLALATLLLVPRFGLIGLGLAELAAIPAFVLLHWQVRRIIGHLPMAVAFAWWAAAAAGLFWREIGIAALLLPIVVLALPQSQRQLRDYRSMLWPRAQASA